MKQIMQDRRSGEILVADVPAPALLEGGVLVETRASLISTGTERSTVEMGEKSLLGKARARPDLVRKVLASVRSKGLLETVRTVQARLGEPAVLGYSAAGVVHAVAPGLDDLQPGMPVACAGQGIASHAEMNFVPRNLVVPLPEGVDAEAGSFVALGAIALHGVRLAGVTVGDQVVVIGLGLVGLLTVQLLRAAGCGVIGFDLVADRVALAASLGADAAYADADALAAAVRARTHDRGADAVLITASTPSSEPVRLAGAVARDRGTVCVVGDVGLEVPRSPYYEKELAFRISRSYGPGRYDPRYELLGQPYPEGFVPWDQRRNMEAFLAMVARGAVRVEPLVSARFPVTDAPAAYRRITARGGDAPAPIAVMLTYPGGLRPAQLGAVQVRDPVAADRNGIAFIGAGNFAQATLLPRFAKLADWRLDTVVTTSGASARTVADRFGFARAGTNADDALARGEIGAVVIATRHDSHARLAGAALRAGHAVFVEKPLAISIAGLRTVLTAARESGNARLLVGFNRRFSAHARQIRAHFPTGVQAMSYRVNAGPLPAVHWTRQRDEGGGRLIGEGCHFVDLMVSLADALVTDVHAVAVPVADGATADTLQVNLRFAGGAVGHLLYVASGDPALPKERLEVFGHGRSAVLDNFQRLELWAAGRRRQTGGGVAVDKGFDGEVEGFGRAARAGGPMPIPFDQLINVTAAMLAAERSLAEGRVVPVNEILAEVDAG